MLRTNFDIFVSHEFSPETHLSLEKKEVEVEDYFNRQKKILLVLREVQGKASSKDLKGLVRFIEKRHIKWHGEYKNRRDELERQCAVLLRVVRSFNSDRRIPFLNRIQYSHPFGINVKVYVTYRADNLMQVNEFVLFCDRMTKAKEALTLLDKKVPFKKKKTIGRKSRSSKYISPSKVFKKIKFSDPEGEPLKKSDLIFEKMIKPSYLNLECEFMDSFQLLSAAEEIDHNLGQEPQGQEFND